MQSIKSPWADTFDQFAGSIRESAIIAAPFITRHPVERLVRTLRSRRRSVHLDVLTNLHADSLIAGSVDSGALAWLCDQIPRATIRHLPGLHAKAYVADGHTAIVTSANLTNGGLIGNYELGLKVTDPQNVHEIAEDLAEYGKLGSVVPLDALAELDDKADSAKQSQGSVVQSAPDNIKTDIAAILNEIDERLRLLRTLPGESTTAIFARAVQYVLRKHGPLSTREINPLIQGLFPDMCDDSVHRVINGVSFGRRWKHQVRNAQVQLRRDGTIVREGNRWRLTNQKESK